MESVSGGFIFVVNQSGKHLGCETFWEWQPGRGILGPELTTHHRHSFWRGNPHPKYSHGNLRYPPPRNSRPY